MNRFLLFVISVYLLCLSGCSSNEPKKETIKESTQPATINEATFLEITAVADGGAYAHEFSGAIWYLRGGEAIRVKEVSQLSSQPTSFLSTKRERALWALLQQERAKRKSAEADKDSYADNSNHSEYDQEY